MPMITASVARQTLPAQLDLVEAGEEVAITRHGRVVAILIQPEALARRRAAGLWAEADRIGEMLEKARREPLNVGSISAERAEELIRDIQESRSAR